VVDVHDDDRLHRRLAPGWVKPDGAIASVAYARNGRPDPEVSVDLARLATPQETAARAGRPGFGVGELVAGVPRALGLTVRHAPVEGNPAHGLIEGNTSLENCRRMARATRVVIGPAPGR
jgi:hypothetical protein